MSLTLSNADLLRMERALTALLSPLAYDGPDSWRAAAMRAVTPVAGADRSVFMMPCPEAELIYREPDEESAIQAYLEYFGQIDVGLHLRRREFRLEAFYWPEVYPPDEWFRSELYNDFGVAYSFLDPCVLSVDVEGEAPPAALLMYRESESSSPLNSDQMAMLRLLMPAFKAGVNTTIRLQHARRRLGVMIDELTDGLAVHDSAGHVLHRNPALRRLLAEDPEGSHIEGECAKLALAVASVEALRHEAGRRLERTDVLTTPTCRRIRTGASSYHLRGSLAPPGLLEAGATVLVLVERLPPRPASDPELRARFGLTPREIAVARRLALGDTDRSIAEALEISYHTARRHTERVLRKLGVHTRAAVGAKLAS